MIKIEELQPKLTDFFQQTIQSNNIGSAYLLYGSDGIGKNLLALDFAEKLSGIDRFNFTNNPNIFFLFPLSSEFYKKFFSGKINNEENYNFWKQLVNAKLLNQDIQNELSNSFPIESIRNIKQQIYFKSESRKVVFIYNAELLSSGSKESANSLLKILEEPPANTTFILICKNIQQVPSTIVSRCIQVKIPKPHLRDFFSQLNRPSFTFEEFSLLAQNNQSNLSLLKSLSDRDYIELVDSFYQLSNYNEPYLSEFYQKMISRNTLGMGEIIYEVNLIISWFVYLEKSKYLKNNLSFNNFQKMQLKLKNIFSEDKYLEIIKHLEKFKEELNSNLSVKNVVLNLIIQLKKLI
jgi:DNA polymerase-3 subunit delta'